MNKQGYKAIVCYGNKEAIKEIEEVETLESSSTLNCLGSINIGKAKY